GLDKVGAVDHGGAAIVIRHHLERRRLGRIGPDQTLAVTVDAHIERRSVGVTVGVLDRVGERVHLPDRRTHLIRCVAVRAVRIDRQHAVVAVDDGARTADRLAVHFRDDGRRGDRVIFVDDVAGDRSRFIATDSGMIVELDAGVDRQERTDPDAACATDYTIFAWAKVRNLDLSRVATNTDQIKNAVITDAGHGDPVPGFVSNLNLSLST